MITEQRIEGPRYMSHMLDWYIPQKALLLILQGNYSIEDSREMNALIVSKLDRSQTPVNLLIDATQMERAYHFSHLRTTQAYMDHPQLQCIYVVASDPLVRLTMTVIFDVSRTPLHLFDHIDKATAAVKSSMGKA